MNWRKNLSGKIKFNEPLSKYTTFKIGGAAEIFFQPKDIADLRQLVINAKKDHQRILVIAGGSNLLINDRGIAGVVIKLDSPFFKRISHKGTLLNAGAGLSLSRLIKYALDYNLSGAEFLTGIPGTVAGALVMNAGISEKIKNQKSKVRNIANLVKAVTVMDYNGKIKILKKQEIKFDYRSSNLYNYIVLRAALRLSKGNQRIIRNNLKQYQQLRKRNLDYAYPSAGCVFKNPKNQSAGWLIDQCGLKGRHFGDAAISKKHANFIINKGKAKAEDVLKLMNLVKKTVEDRFGIPLEPEIKIWQ
jgi:UDP-N-acetylmuramate dehydrogenase